MHFCILTVSVFAPVSHPLSPSIIHPVNLNQIKMKQYKYTQQTECFILIAVGQNSPESFHVKLNEKTWIPAQALAPLYLGYDYFLI